MLRVTIERKNIAPVFDLNVETLLDLVEVFVKLAAKFGKSMSVVGFERDSVRCRASVQMLFMEPVGNRGG